MEKNDNVTRRKPPLTRAKSLEGIDDSSSSNSTLSCDLMVKSLDLSTHALTSNLEDMKIEISNLRTNLSSTQSELENVILENNGLKKQISLLAQEVEVLKQICRSPVSSLRRNVSSTSKKSAKRRLTDSFKNSPLTFSTMARTSQVKNCHTEAKTQEEPFSELPHSSPVAKENDIHIVECAVNLGNEDMEDTYVKTTFIAENFNQQTENSPPSVSKPTTNVPVYKKPRPSSSPFPNNDSKPSRRVLILADENGRNIGEFLQKLLGDKFQVFSFIKSYASTKQVLELCKTNCRDFTGQDFVILLTGSNDSNPLELQSCLYCCMCELINTNVLLGTVFKNKRLNEHNVNKLLRLVTSHFKNSRILEWDTYYDINHRRNVYTYDKKFICRFILKDILQICYRNEYLDSCLEKTKHISNRIICKNASTQTTSCESSADLNIVCEFNHVSSQTDRSTVNETFFREQH